MTKETRDPKYLQAAIRAGDYVWKSWGTRGLFVGGASDNPDITDKEAAMLSLEAFLASAGSNTWGPAHGQQWPRMDD